MNAPKPPATPSQEAHALQTEAEDLLEHAKEHPTAAGYGIASARFARCAAKWTEAADRARAREDHEREAEAMRDAGLARRAASAAQERAADQDDARAERAEAKLRARQGVGGRRFDA